MKGGKLRPHNSFDNRKALTDKTKWAGREWYYPFTSLPALLEEDAAEKRIQRVLENYSGETRRWNNELNSDWVCRIYFATKLLMMATLQINSLTFAEEHNLRVVEPHLRYYALFSLCKAVCFTLPDLEWAGGDLLKMTHERVVRHAVAYISTFSQKSAASVDSLFRLAKAHRELIDYNAPSEGDAQLVELKQLIATCRLLAEFAQMNSELLERSFEKHTADAEFELIESRLWTIFQVEIEGHSFLDEEDIRRIGYIMRKHPRPTSILMMLTDGHVEDFFGAWVDEGQTTGNFDPDRRWDIVFDL